MSCEFYFTNENITFSAQLYKYDGTTETSISSEVTSSAVTGTAPQNYRATFNFPIASILFKKGEILRLKIRGKVDDSGNYLWINSGGTQPLILNIPYRIDI